MIQFVSPWTQRLNCTVPVPPVVELAVAKLDAEPEVAELVFDAVVLEDAPVADVLLVLAVDEAPPEPDEPDALDDFGMGGPRLWRMSLSIRENSARARMLCSTISRPAWA
jgi:hypothetical protein